MQHKDLVGRLLHEGDVVAYPTQSGSSSRMCVARIVKIETYQRNAHRYNRETKKHYSETVEDWRVRLQPLEYTDFRVDKRYYRDDEGNFTSAAIKPKQVTVNKVENLVRVDYGTARW